MSLSLIRNLKSSSVDYQSFPITLGESLAAGALPALSA